MTTIDRTILFLFPIALLVGCAGGQEVTLSYDSESNRSKYETDSYTVSSVSGSGYASSQSISMRVVARCEGKNCRPDTAELVFGIDGSDRLLLSGVSGEIIADDAQIQWSDVEANRGFAGTTQQDDPVRVLGEFATVDVNIDQLQKIATATSLKGSVGGKTLSLGSDVQSGIQTLLQKMRRGTSGSSSSDAAV